MSGLYNELNLSISINSQPTEILLLPYQCRICGAPAKYSYFGAISCDSCKIFFRRNAERERTLFKCQFNGHCEININNRFLCKPCRLAKCFKCGMTPDRFRTSTTNRSKIDALVSINVQQHQRLKKLSTRNLLESDQSLLSPDQWILLSNLLKCYNESSILLNGQHIVDSQKNLQSMNITNTISIENYLSSVYETAGMYLRSNSDICKLPFDDRTILVTGAANNLVSASAAFTGDYFHLLSVDTISNTVTETYGKNVLDIHRWALKFIDPDMVLMKLAISIFALSETIYSYSSTISIELTNPLLILEVQNKYAEITWKYLLYKYGYYGAVKRFLNLVLWFNALILYMYHGQNLTKHLNDINSLIEQTEITLILDDVEQIVK